MVEVWSVVLHVEFSFTSRSSCIVFFTSSKLFGWMDFKISNKNTFQYDMFEQMIIEYTLYLSVGRNCVIISELRYRTCFSNSV